MSQLLHLQVTPKPSMPSTSLLHQIPPMPKLNPEIRSKISVPNTSNPTPLRRSPRLNQHCAVVDVPKTPSLPKNNKLPTSLRNRSCKDTSLTPKTPSFCEISTTYILKSDENGGKGRVLRRSTRSCKLVADYCEKDVIAMTDTGRRRSIRLLGSTEGVSREMSSGTNLLKEFEVRDGEKDVKFEDSTPERTERKKERKGVKRKIGSKIGVMEELGKIVEGEEDKEGGTTPCSGDSFARIGFHQSGQRVRFSTPKVVRIGEEKKGTSCGDAAGDRNSLGGLEWTVEEDNALQRAYLKARPSPHFWKKVSKMVPGKSAKECFDRIHSSYVTPPLFQRPPRLNKIKSSPVSHLNLSGGNPSIFFKESMKKARSKKQQKLLAQRTVRHLLKKHCLAEQQQQADLFPVFETCINPPIKEMVSATKSPQLDGKCIPTIAVRASLPAKFRSLGMESKPSPEVLKKVRNMALHEKYIDQLHCREVGRKVSKTDYKLNAVPQVGAVKAAKNALLSEAREVIIQFQNPNTLSNNSSDIDEENDSDFRNDSEFEDV